MKITLYTDSPEKTEEVGKRLAAALLHSNTPRALIAMRGEMGVGKTAFVRGFASELGIKYEEVTKSGGESYINVGLTKGGKR